jgi:hypothetical protein
VNVHENHGHTCATQTEAKIKLVKSPFAASYQTSFSPAQTETKYTEIMDDTAPTFGWICTDPCLLEMADRMLDEKYENLLVKTGDANMHRYGRIGSVNVVINCLAEPSRAADAAHIAQNMAATFTDIKSIVVTGFGVRSTGTRLGDLVISPGIIRHGRDAELNLTPVLNIAERAIYVLQREIGTDGVWLSSKLHYGNIDSESQDIQVEELRNRLATLESIKDFDTVAAGISAGTPWRN